MCGPLQARSFASKCPKLLRCSLRREICSRSKPQGCSVSSRSWSWSWSQSWLWTWTSLSLNARLFQPARSRARAGEFHSSTLWQRYNYGGNKRRRRSLCLLECANIVRLQWSYCTTNWCVANQCTKPNVCQRAMENRPRSTSAFARDTVININQR